MWIPISKQTTDGKQKIKGSNKEVEINLGRYVFEEDGTINTTLSQTEPNGQLKTINQYEQNQYYTEGLKEDTTINMHAKDIHTFIESTKQNGGYYIGRYEARTLSERTSVDNKLEQVTVKEDDFIYHKVKQSQAAELSQGMYKTDKNFTSDLINSYAWDTAILFMQEFGQTNYSNQTSLNTSFANKGTNHLTDPTKQDKVCNIWDIASNVNEWTTETYSLSTQPGVYRAGHSSFSIPYKSTYRCMCGINVDAGFRLLLYFNR